MHVSQRIREFLDGGPFAVVGASTDRAKYGNKCLRCYLQAGREAVPVNPDAAEVEGLRAFPDLASIPGRVHAATIVTPPHVSEQVVREAGRLGVRHVWMQPGAESDAALRLAEDLGLSVIAGGPCLLIELGFRE